MNRTGTNQNPYLQPLESFQTPQPFQNPYVQQPESFQTPQPLQNPYVQQPESFQTPQLFQSASIASLDRSQAMQEYQNAYQSQDEDCNELPNPEYAPATMHNLNQENSQSGRRLNQGGAVVNTYG
jgi:hypothetical protein